MFLGTMFGAINVFGNGVGGFVFGFILASAPTFLIVHMLFYKGLKQIVKMCIRDRAKPTNTFRLCTLTIAKQLAVWRLEHNGVSL